MILFAEGDSCWRSEVRRHLLVRVSCAEGWTGAGPEWSLSGDVSAHESAVCVESNLASGSPVITGRRCSENDHHPDRHTGAHTEAQAQAAHTHTHTLGSDRMRIRM
jgi:hypothetical protein